MGRFKGRSGLWWVAVLGCCAGCYSYGDDLTGSEHLKLRCVGVGMRCTVVPAGSGGAVVPAAGAVGAAGASAGSTAPATSGAGGVAGGAVAGAGGAAPPAAGSG